MTPSASTTASTLTRVPQFPLQTACPTNNQEVMSVMRLLLLLCPVVNTCENMQRGGGPVVLVIDTSTTPHETLHILLQTLVLTTEGIPICIFPPP